MLAVCLPLVAGCGSSGPTAQDTAFENDLAKAAEKNKSAPKTKKKLTLSDVEAKNKMAPSVPATGN